MRRTLVGVLAAGTLALPAAVLAGDGSGQLGAWGGRAVDDPRSYVTFDVVSRDGEKTLARLHLNGAKLTCADPASSGRRTGDVRSRFPFDGRGFEGSRSYTPSGSAHWDGARRVSVHIRGRFKTDTKITGSYRLAIRDDEGGRCTTGPVAFTARKPASNPPPFYD